MNEDTVKRRVCDSIAEVLKVDAESITTESGPGNPPEWDSLGNVAIIQAVEESFGVSFDILDLMDVEMVQDLIDLTLEALGN